MQNITSVTNKIWHLKKIDEHRLTTLIQKYNFCEILARIIANKKISYDSIDGFLNPRLRDTLPDPFHLLDMNKAVNRTIEAIYDKQKICIFGDYDVDGATSSALLKNFFSDIGLSDVTIYIPDRITEGYGLNIDALTKIKQNGTQLMITVDCGTSGLAAVDHANDIGLTTIVIDHHLGGEILPKACAVVNPNRLDETSQYTYIAAVGVSFLFITALTKTLKLAGYFKSVPEPNLLKYLDLVALGTVCDVMPLIGLNRVFVSQGLKVMARRQNLGLKILSDLVKLDGPPSCYHLGFIIGPRINAGGRVGESWLGSYLLTSQDPLVTKQYAIKLHEYNDQRKYIESKVLEEAIALAEQHKHDTVLVLAKAGWHQGVIGIIAGKIKELYGKPTAIITIDGDIGKASCRSIKNVDLGSKIVEAKFNNLILEGGGHAMAAGFTVHTNKISELREFLCQTIARDLEGLGVNNDHEYEAILNINSLTLELVKSFEQLQPYGNHNSEPCFRIDNLFVLEAKIVGNSHVSCLFGKQKNSYGSGAIRAIAFNAVASPIGTCLMSKKACALSVIGYLKINHYNNTESINITINDLIISG